MRVDRPTFYNLALLPLVLEECVPAMGIQLAVNEKKIRSVENLNTREQS
jgi:hypothetical protein